MGMAIMRRKLTMVSMIIISLILIYMFVGSTHITSYA